MSMLSKWPFDLGVAAQETAHRSHATFKGPIVGILSRPPSWSGNDRCLRVPPRPFLAGSVESNPTPYRVRQAMSLELKDLPPPSPNPVSLSKIPIQMKRLADYLAENNWGDLASAVGLGITLLGFSLTIYLAARSRSAAIQARAAAVSVREEMTRFDTVSNLAAAITAMEETKRLHRASAWQTLPDRYSAVRQQLVFIRTANPGFSSQHRAALLGAIQQFSDLEQVVEKTLSYGRKAPKASQLNKVVSDQIDKLNEILDVVRQMTGAEMA